MLTQACTDDPEPAHRELQFAEIVDVHGCRPGTWEVGEGDNMTCIDPWHGGGGGGGSPGGGGGERSPGGPGGGGPAEGVKTITRRVRIPATRPLTGRTPDKAAG